MEIKIRKLLSRELTIRRYCRKAVVFRLDGAISWSSRQELDSGHGYVDVNWRHLWARFRAQGCAVSRWPCHRVQPVRFKRNQLINLVRDAVQLHMIRGMSLFGEHQGDQFLVFVEQSQPLKIFGRPDIIMILGDWLRKAWDAVTVVASHFNPYNTVTEDDPGVHKREHLFDLEHAMDIDEDDESFKLGPAGGLRSHHPVSPPTFSPPSRRSYQQPKKAEKAETTTSQNTKPTSSPTGRRPLDTSASSNVTSSRTASSSPAKSPPKTATYTPRAVKSITAPKRRSVSPSKKREASPVRPVKMGSPAKHTRSRSRPPSAVREPAGAVSTTTDDHAKRSVSRSGKRQKRKSADDSGPSRHSRRIRGEPLTPQEKQDKKRKTSASTGAGKGIKKPKAT